MKKITLITLMLAGMVFGSHAQKIQVKNGVISRDKEPIAKLEGEATLKNGAHLKIKSMSDEPLITLDETQVLYKSFFQEGLFFYTITFHQTNQSVNRIIDARYTSEKKILDNLYKEIGADFLTKDGLNKELVSAYVTAHDDSKKLQADTTHLSTLVASNLERLKQPLVARDPKARIHLETTSEEFKWKGNEPWRNLQRLEERSTFGIYQGDVLLGIVIKFRQKTMVNEDYTSSRYYVLRRVEPFTVDGDNIKFVTLASLTADYNNTGTIEIDNQNRRNFQKVGDFKNEEHAFVAKLIAEGLL